MYDNIYQTLCGTYKNKCSCCRKNKIDDMTSLLERNNINLPENLRRRDNQDWDPQQERGHALMEGTSKPTNLLIDSGALNHMMESRDSFSSLDTNKSIPIHMGDDSTITSKGRGTVNLEHGNFYDVLYVPSLASNLLCVYFYTKISSPSCYDIVIPLTAPIPQSFP